VVNSRHHGVEHGSSRSASGSDQRDVWWALATHADHDRRDGGWVVGWSADASAKTGVFDNEAQDGDTKVGVERCAA